VDGGTTANNNRTAINDRLRTRQRRRRLNKSPAAARECRPYCGRVKDNRTRYILAIYSLCYSTVCVSLSLHFVHWFNIIIVVVLPVKLVQVA